MGRDGYEIAERLDLTWLGGSADEDDKGQSGEWRRTEGGREGAAGEGGDGDGDGWW